MSHGRKVQTKLIAENCVSIGGKELHLHVKAGQWAVMLERDEAEQLIADLDVCLYADWPKSPKDILGEVLEG